MRLVTLRLPHARTNRFALRAGRQRARRSAAVCVASTLNAFAPSAAGRQRDLSMISPSTRPTLRISIMRIPTPNDGTLNFESYDDGPELRLAESLLTRGSPRRTSRT
jgi:microcin C transport system substrate-binding protein